MGVAGNRVSPALYSSYTPAILSRFLLYDAAYQAARWRRIKIYRKLTTSIPRDARDGDAAALIRSGDGGSYLRTKMSPAERREKGAARVVCEGLEAFLKARKRRASAVGRNEHEDRRRTAGVALFKQRPPLFACNYQADDLTLATLHLYNTVPRCTVRYASVAFRCVPFGPVPRRPRTAPVIVATCPERAEILRMYFALGEPRSVSFRGVSRDTG